MVFVLVCVVFCLCSPPPRPGAEQADLTVTDILFDQSIYMSFADFCFLTSYGGL